MTLDDIERVLGETVTEDVQDSVTRALAAAERLSDPQQGRDAVQELLIAMLAAVLITPRDGAKLRANYAAERLLAVVEASLIEGRPS